MAKSVTLNINDTAISGGPQALSVSLPAINWPVDWSKTVDEAGSATLTYKPAPFDAPQTAKFAVNRIANIYAGSPVDASYQLPYKRGASILCQVNLVASVTDTADSTYRVDLPLSAHLVIKAPMSGLLTVNDIRSVAERAFALLYETGSTDSTRLTELLKGSMLPEGV